MKKKKKKKVEQIITARYSAANGGFGFAVPVDGSMKKDFPADIFIPAKFRGNAIDGDIVQVKVIPGEEDDRYCGIITAITERTRKTIVAQLNSRRTARPMDRHLPEEVKVNQLPKSAKIGDLVKLRLLDTGKKHTETLRTEAIETFGPVSDVNSILNAVVSEFDLAEPYTEKQDAAAGKLEAREIRRVNMTRAFTVTIDPTDAHDFDDAVSIGKSGKYILLGVHIADVAAYIKPGSTFDKEAYKRSFSAYLPGRFLPMLPKSLTAKISLRAGVESPAHSVLFTIDPESGEILKTERVHTLVKINKRLDFKSVQDFIDDPAEVDWDKTTRRNMEQLVRIFRLLRENRRKKELFLDMPIPEVRVLCDEAAGKITGLQRKVQTEADALVEEFMLAANSAVAGEIISKSIAGLFRIHPEPDEAKIDLFADNCITLFHYSPGNILGSRKNCAHFLETLANDHKKPVILSMFLRSLPRASYQAEPGLHYGLGKEKYSHFTSPIRRYPDLALHQQLWELDTNGKLKSRKKLEEIAEHCSAKEENNDNAYYAATDRMKLLYLRENGALENGSIYEGVINRVTSAGLLCSVDELCVFGFIPREKLRGGSFRRSARNREKLSAVQGHTSYKAGDFVYVALDTVDTVRGNVVFRLAF